MELVDRANERLRAGNTGVAIYLRDRRLYLRATLPPKPGSNQAKPYQQKISLGVYANSAGVKEAELRAKDLGVQLAQGKFFWAAWQKPDVAAQQVQRWAKKYEDFYFSTRSRTDKTIKTWVSDYLEAFRHLDGEADLTVELLREAILKVDPASRTRKRLCMVFGGLAKFAGLELDVKALQGSYSARRILPRDLPNDEVIVGWYEKIKLRNPLWANAYGLLACYGLRPHELWELDLDSLKTAPGILLVVGGKTGSREVFPCYPEWWERWGLGAELELPQSSGKSVGQRVSQFFRRAGVPFDPYDLRHKWPGRMALCGFDTATVAYQMGHGIEVHYRYYGHWYNRQHQQQVFNLLMSRADRPRPPEPI